jgi:hypothetical protein
MNSRAASARRAAWAAAVAAAVLADAGGVEAALFLARCGETAAPWSPALLAAHVLAYPLTTVLMLLACGLPSPSPGPGAMARRALMTLAMLAAMPLLCPLSRALAASLLPDALRPAGFGLAMLLPGAAVRALRSVSARWWATGAGEGRTACQRR